ncbi:GTP-binding protein [Elongatibacter sediminis]|uniref:GTP-binding protein n=1 Tax=Elongatibacter sediminis TaxID=3119006 RepID=A0AAW9RPP1_9GAMM
MRIWNRVRSALPAWWRKKAATESSGTADARRHWLAANRNLKSLLEDTSIPSGIRAELADEFEQIERITQKLDRDEVHVAAYGRVGVGKSSLLNALLGREAFRTSALHGETRREARADWQSLKDGQAVLLDTPGIDELDGGARERLARDVSLRADVILMVCEGDLTRIEHAALGQLARLGRTVVLVLNKADRYTRTELSALLQRLAERTRDWLPAEHIIAVSAHPRPEIILRTGPDGREEEMTRPREPDVKELRAVLWQLLEREGKVLAALNASLFASELDARVAQRIVAARRDLAERLIHKYCLAKGLLVAVNPVPVADLLAAAGTDIAMVTHLGRIYGFRMQRSEASRLLMTISAQLVALMGAYWGLNLVSSALKTASAGLSTTLTATAQGALAWYATYLVGRMAQTWFARGKSWGGDGPREVARSILATLDRDELLREARTELRNRIQRSSA